MGEGPTVVDGQAGRMQIGAQGHPTLCRAALARKAGFYADPQALRHDPTVLIAAMNE